MTRTKAVDIVTGAWRDVFDVAPQKKLRDELVKRISEALDEKDRQLQKVLDGCQRIAAIVDDVDALSLAADGPVTPFAQAITRKQREDLDRACGALTVLYHESRAADVAAPPGGSR